MCSDNTTTDNAAQQPEACVWVAPRADKSGHVIHVEGHFDFSVYRSFRDAYRGVPAGTQIDVDLSNATYMDSAALGMLLMLREHLDNDGNRVILRVSQSSEIRRMLEVVGFGEFFTLA